MNAVIRDGLHRVAETKTPVLAVPAGLFDRARRRHRRRRLGALIAVVAIAIGGGISVTASLDTRPAPAAVDDRVDDMPAEIVEAPRWTAGIERAPMRRALAAYDIHSGTGNSTSVTLVGPDDQYRTFDPARLGGRWTEVFKLSPDGRYLLTGHADRTQLLDIATGKTRMIDLGEPLAWSPDGKQAILVRYENSEGPVSGLVHVVDMPSGTVALTIPLEPGPAPRSVLAAMSHDGSMLVLQRHSDLFAYRAGDGAPLWTDVADGHDLLGFARDGAFLLGGGTLCSRGAEAGADAGCVGYQQMVTRMLDRPRSVMLNGIVDWAGPAPLVKFGDGVVRLTETPQWLLRARDARDLQVATDRVRWSSRQPGPPDPGPAFERYRPVIDRAALGVVLVGLIVAVVIWRRRRTGVL